MLFPRKQSMLTSKLFICATFVLVLVSDVSVVFAQISPLLFREYIGAEWNNVTFSDVPINPNVTFHFILSFAIDYTNSTPSVPSNGQFSVYWDNENLSPSSVLDIKAKHPNVKVAMSLGGDSISNQSVNFSPTSIDSWVNNATYSITDIVNEYHLDGIDIDYEHFDSDPDIFAECIGRLLSNLKANQTISFTSIAPYANETVQQHYSALWKKYGNLIDFVNFQFYAYDNTTNATEFVDYFNTQTSIYNGGKILVSFGTYEGAGLSPSNGFFEACKILEKEGKLQGIFIWSADDSKDANFSYEHSSQQFLTQTQIDRSAPTPTPTQTQTQPKETGASSAIAYHGMLMLGGFLLSYICLGWERSR